MAEENKNKISRPPSNIRIRTLKSDVEEMRESGGQVNVGRILGKRLEDIEGRKEESMPQEKAQPFFETEGAIPSQQEGRKKSKVLPIIIGLIFIFILGGGTVYFLLKPSIPKEVIPTPTETPPPAHTSLFINPLNEKIFAKYKGGIVDLERIISQEFRENFEPNNAKEIVLTVDVGERESLLSGELFLETIFSNFPEINSSVIPNFKEQFSFMIFNPGAEGINRLGYILELDVSDIPVFAISNIKSNFSTEFERMISQNPEILTSHYLQDPGVASGVFSSLDIGPISTRFLRFSTGLEFYYGWYNNYFLSATSQESFIRLSSAILPKI